MAWGSLGQNGTRLDKVAGTTIVHTTELSLAAGDVCVIIVSKDNAATSNGNTNEITGVTDSVGGNTWVKVKEFCNAGGAANAGVTTAIFLSKLTNALPAASTITATFSDSQTASTATAWGFSIAAGKDVQVVETVDLANAAAACTMDLSAVSAVEHLFIHAVGAENNLPPGGSWTGGNAFGGVATTGGAANGNNASGGHYKIATPADATYQMVTTGGTSGPDMAHILVALKEVAQVHGLTATGTTTGSPALGSPALGQVHGVTATALATGSPVLGTPVVGQVHVLAATGATTGSPVLGAPTLGQVHALGASALTTGPPVLGTPAVTQPHALTANALATGAPALGTPALGQNHVLTANAVATGSPVLDSPGLDSAADALTADNLTTGSPDLGTPVLARVYHFLAALGAGYGATIFSYDGTDTTGWTENSHADFTSVGGRFRVTASTGAGVPSAGRSFPTTIGEVYELGLDAFFGTVSPRTAVSSTPTEGGQFPGAPRFVSTGNIAVAPRSYQFIPTATTSYVQLSSGAATIDLYSEFDNIVLREVRRGIVGGSPTIGIGPEVTNLFNWSEDLTNVFWTKDAATIEANAGIAPDGTTTADKLVCDTSNAIHMIRSTVSIAVGEVLSAYVKPAGYRYLRVDRAGLQGGLYFDLQDGIIVGWTSADVGDFSDAIIKPAANGFWRVSFVLASATTTSIRWKPVPANGTAAFVGDGVSGAFFWGLQREAPGTLEAGRYVSTAGGSATSPGTSPPALGQVHALAANPVATGSPALGTPTVGTIHNLAATALATGSPVLGSPALGQKHALVATALAVSSPAIGSPALGQHHSLSATNLATSAPALGSPALHVIRNLTAANLATGAPALGSPAVGQVHALVAANLTTGSPVLGSPQLTQPAILTGLNTVTGSPVLGSPALGQVHVLASDGTTTASPVLGTPALGQAHGLVANSTVTGSPDLGSPVMVRVVHLLADTLTTGSPTLGSPAIGQGHALAAVNLATGSPALGSPSFGQGHVLTSGGTTTASPDLWTPILGQVHTLDAISTITASPDIGSPAMVHVVWLPAADPTVTGPPDLGTPALGQAHALVATDAAMASPVLGQPLLLDYGVLYVLVANNLVTGSPVLGTPVLRRWASARAGTRRTVTGLGTDERLVSADGVNRVVYADGLSRTV